MSFKPTAENLPHIRSFLSRISDEDRKLVFEPGGSEWTDEALRNLTEDVDTIHGVDPLLRFSVTSGLRYYRLHGRPEYTYHHSYSGAGIFQ